MIVDDLVDEPMSAARAASEVAVRRALYPGLALAFEEPERPDRGLGGEWAAIVAGVAPAVGSGVVLRRAGDEASRTIAASRLAANVTRGLAGAYEPAALDGPAMEHARAIVAAALTTLERLADDGWRAVLGDSLDGAEQVRLGADSVAERTEAFDPFGRALATVG